MTDGMVAARLARIDGMLDDIAEANDGILATLCAPPPRRGQDQTARVVLLDDHRNRA